MAEKKKKFSLNKNVLFILAIPILVALGVVIGSYFSSSAVEEPVEEEVEKTVNEQTLTLDEFVLNLEPTGNVRRYIRLELALSTIQEDGLEKIEDKINVIRDVIIYEVSRESVDNIFEDGDKRFALKEHLKDKINEALDDDLIYEVYISNMIIQ